jgi:cell division protein FtsW (lipid II flippase)
MFNKKGKGIDYLLLWAVFLLSLIECIILYKDSFYYLKRHALFLFSGVLVGLMTYKAPLSFWIRNTRLLLITFVLLVLVLFVTEGE